MIKKFFTLLCLCTLCIGSAWGDYVKITSTAELTDGQYLIVYTSGNVALDGSLTTIDVSSNTVPVTVNNFKIVSSDKIDAAAFTFSASNGAFLGTNGLYITHTGSKNTLDTSTTPVGHSISFSDGNVALSVGLYTLKYNKTSGQTRFRYYTSGQEAIQLYKKESSSNILKVTYDGNGSTSGDVPVDENEYDVDASVTVLGNTGNLAKNGYTFAGWNTKADGTGEDYSVGASFEIKASVTLYAKWAANEYEVTYFINGQETTGNYPFGKSLDEILPESPSTPGGYYFMGWSEAEVATIQTEPTYTSATTVPINGIILYAVFAKQNGSGGESTSTLDNNTIKNNKDGKGSYSNDYNIEGWTGRYLLGSSGSTYYMQLGYNTDTSKSAHNSHLTTPSSTKTIKSITINTNNNTTSGRTFYLCATDNLGAADAEDAVYGLGSISEAAGSVTITVTNSPTQVYIYPNGTAYIESVSVTYNDVSYYDYTTFVGYTREVTAGNFGTICLPYASSATAGATFYTLAGKKMNDQEVASIVLEEVEGNLVAGTPYIFKASDNEITVAYTGAVSEAGSANGLIGTFERIEQLERGTYIVSGTNFYKVDSDVSCGENRAYIDMSKVSQSQAKGDIEMFNGSEPTSINGMNIEIISNSPMYNLNGQRVNSNYNGVVLKNGKKYLNK